MKGNAISPEASSCKYTDGSGTDVEPQLAGLLVVPSPTKNVQPAIETWEAALSPLLLNASTCAALVQPPPVSVTDTVVAALDASFWLKIILKVPKPDTLLALEQRSQAFEMVSPLLVKPVNAPP